MPRGRTYHGKYWRDTEHFEQEKDFFLNQAGKKTHYVENVKHESPLFTKGEITGALLAVLFLCYGVFSKEFDLIFLTLAFLVFLLRRLLPNKPFFMACKNLLLGFSLAVFFAILALNCFF